MIQAYHAIMTSMLFTDNKEVWFYGEKNQARQDMFIHIMLIDPFRFMFIFRNIYKPNGTSMFVNFQIIGEECEIISVFREEGFKYTLIPVQSIDNVLTEIHFTKKFHLKQLKEFGAKFSQKIKGGGSRPPQQQQQPQTQIRPPHQ